MIRYKICNLRSSDWTAMNRRDLEDYVRDREADGEDVSFQIVPWTREYYGSPSRSYVVLFSDGGIYAIFFRRLECY